jgi:uncharacterized protein YecA (UPF0149 family)
MNGFSSESVNIVEEMKKRREQIQALKASKEAPQAPTRLPKGFPRFISGTPAPITRVAPKIKPNDPCPCGSGRKFKKCCRRKQP